MGRSSKTRAGLDQSDVEVHRGPRHRFDIAFCPILSICLWTRLIDPPYLVNAITLIREFFNSKFFFFRKSLKREGWGTQVKVMSSQGFQTHTGHVHRYIDKIGQRFAQGLDSIEYFPPHKQGNNVHSTIRPQPDKNIQNITLGLDPIHR